MGTVWTITAKDLRQRFRDRSVLLLAFVVPLGLALVFDLLFGGLTAGELGLVKLAVADLDDGPAGQAFTGQFLPAVTEAMEADGTSIVVEELPSHEAARDAVDAGTHDAAIVVPTGMSGAMQAGDPITLEVLTHADRSLVGSVATSLAELFAQQARGRLAAQVLAQRLQLPADRASEFADALASVQGRVGLDTSPVPGRQLDMSTYLAAGMAVFFLFFTVQFGVLGYLEERRDGTLPRLHAAPIGRWQVLAAKTLTSLIVGAASVAVLMLVSVPLLGATWGDPAAVTLLVVAAVVAATSLVAVVAVVARTAEQANTWQSIVAVVLGMLGGAFFPIRGGPEWLAQLSLVAPHAWFLRGLSTLGDPSAGVGEVVRPIGAMLAFAVLMALLAGVLARRRGDA